MEFRRIPWIRYLSRPAHHLAAAIWNRADHPAISTATLTAAEGRENPELVRAATLPAAGLCWPCWDTS